MSLIWKSRLPAVAGWYWVRKNGAVMCAQVSAGAGGMMVNKFTPLRVTTYDAWAGPIAPPREPSAEQLATVRYKLDGAYLPPSTGGWGQYEWDFVERAEMLRRAKVRLCGGEDYQGKPWPADSEWVSLFTSRRVGGHWARQTGERFTKDNIDAAIAAEAAKGAKA
jgi:hypothetical protein